MVSFSLGLAAGNVGKSSPCLFLLGSNQTVYVENTPAQVVGESCQMEPSPNLHSQKDNVGCVHLSFQLSIQVSVFHSSAQVLVHEINYANPYRHHWTLATEQREKKGGEPKKTKPLYSLGSTFLYSLLRKNPLICLNFHSFQWRSKHLNYCNPRNCNFHSIDNSETSKYLKR